MAAERPRVTVATGVGEHVAGELRAVGRDVITVGVDGDTHALVYVPVTAVMEVLGQRR
jgi:hypothetical protein